MLGMRFDKISPDCFLAIEGEDNIGEAASNYANYHEWHHMVSRGLKGTIYVLFIESTEHMLFVYQGKVAAAFQGP
ncbi:MAG: hypothetical protein MZV63_51750 [Marinilabiliales bacterium]|nr:hypothetical protein [Marinilabiliales bacterium]